MSEDTRENDIRSGKKPKKEVVGIVYSQREGTWTRTWLNTDLKTLYVLKQMYIVVFIYYILYFDFFSVCITTHSKQQKAVYSQCLGI